MKRLRTKSIKGSIEEQQLANKALRELTQWRITFIEGSPGSDLMAEQFSEFLRSRGVLPQNEVNDGLILAEASLAGAALLVSNDSHLSQIDPDELRILFEERELNPIPVTTPKKLLRIFEKQQRRRPSI